MEITLQDAVEKGAKVCIVSKDIGAINGIAIIKVEDTLKALQDIATFKRMQYDIPVVAITGSVEKQAQKI